MEKIRRWNAKTFTVILEDDDFDVDLCILKDWKEICTIEHETKKPKWKEFEYSIRIAPELSKLLGKDEEDEWYSYEVRVEKEPVEEGELLIIKKKDEDNQEND